MTFASFDAKEQVRQAIDIVELAGSYLQLRREGRGFKALCPWHDDTRPSLQINPHRQSFKCWVCDIGGDIFSFIMKMERVEFPEALAMLADRAGIDLRAYHAASSSAGGGNEERGGGTPRADDKRALFKAMAWAEDQYHRCLVESPEAEGARRYLDQRGITEESIERYRLGYSPLEWGWLLNRAQAAGVAPALLERVGLLSQRPQGGGYYDRFRGRVLFSIRDPQSRPVGLGGRILPELAETSPAKYINSPETPLFSKSKLLYGLDTARDAISRSKTALVMEGYTDCIVARQFGIANCVAVLGTALGERQIKLLRSYADSIVLVLDGDAAGQRRTNEILELFIAEQIDLRIMTLPDDLDPCDFLLERGAAAFQALLSQAVDALEHAVRVEMHGLDVRNRPHDASRALESILHTIGKSPRLRDNTSTEYLLRESAMLGRLSRQFEVREEVLRQRLSEIRRGSHRPTRRDDESENAACASLSVTTHECELLEILLLAPQLVMDAADDLDFSSLPTPVVRQILGKCRELITVGILPDFNRLLLEFDDPAIKNLLVELDEQGEAKSAADPAPRLKELLAWFRDRGEDRALQSRARDLQEHRLDDQQSLDLLQQLIRQQRTRQGISSPTDG